MIEKIKKLDLTYIANRLINKYDWSLKQAEEAIRRYKKFLILRYKYPRAALVPTKDIDEIWHNHILHTREYLRDCKTLFGGYIHHRPFRDSDNVKAKEKMAEKYYKTSVLYLKEFQESYSQDLDVSSFW